MNGFEPSITALMDWSDDELLSLGDLSVHYSGISTIYEAIPINQHEYSSQRQSTEYCVGSLIELSGIEKACSTSWATSIIDIASQIAGEPLSVNQLLECLPIEEEIDPCQGIHPKSLVNYLSEVGLVGVNEFTSCDSIRPNYSYHFTPVYPESPNAGGLMNLIAEGKPVFAMVALDLTRLRYVKDMSNSEMPLRCGGYEPSLYGIVSGYKYDEVMIEDSYWELVSHIIPCEEVVIHIPMTTNMTNGNYGGIAAYAFTLDVTPRNTVFSVSERTFPSIESIPAFATELIFEENSYPELTYLDLSRFTQLKKVTLMNNAVTNANALYINNPSLEVILIGDHCLNGEYNENGRRLVDNWYTSHQAGLIMRDARLVQSMTIGMNTMTRFNRIRLVHVNNDMTLTTGSSSLKNVNSIELPMPESIGVDLHSLSSSLISSIQLANVNEEINIQVNEYVPNKEEIEVPGFVIPTTLPPTTLPPTTLPPTTLPPTPTPTPTPSPCLNAEPLIVSTEADCLKITSGLWNSITVNEGLCNSIKSDLVIENMLCLQNITIQKNSFKYLKTLTIQYNPSLERFTTENAVTWDGLNHSDSAMTNVNTITFQRISIIHSFTLRSSFFYYICCWF